MAINDLFLPQLWTIANIFSKIWLETEFLVTRGYGYILNLFYLETQEGKKIGDFFCNVIR